MKQLFLFAAFCILASGLWAQQSASRHSVPDIKPDPSGMAFMIHENQKMIIEIRNTYLTAKTTLDSAVTYRFSSESDSSRLKMREFYWNETGFTELEYSWNYTNNQWDILEKSDYTFNENDYLTTYYGFLWDTELNDWKNYKDYTSFYNDLGLEDSTVMLRWNDNAESWDNSYASKYRYDTSANQIEYVWWKGDDNNEWRAESKSTYSYDTGGNKINKTSYKWDTTHSEWLKLEMIEYIYNISGQLDTSYYYSWLSERFGAEREMGDTRYDIVDSSSILFGKITAIGWNLYNMYRFEYDENNNRTAKLNYWLQDNQWKLDDKWEYYYDEHSNTIRYVLSQWNAEDSVWKPRWKTENEYTYEYDEEGKPAMFSYYEWDVDYNVWMGTSKTDFLRDDEGKSRIDIDYDWNVFTNDWAVDKKEFYCRSELIGIPESEREGFLVYPNPVKSILHIKNEYNQTVSCFLISMDGQKLRQFNMYTTDLQMDIGDLPGGVYFLQISTESKTTIKKIVKQ